MTDLTNLAAHTLSDIGKSRGFFSINVHLIPMKMHYLFHYAGKIYNFNEWQVSTRLFLLL